MGSRTSFQNRRRNAVDRILAKEEPTEQQAKLAENFPRRHKCVGCGTGGHLRRAPVVQTDTGVRVRFGARA